MDNAAHWKAKPHHADYDEMRARLLGAAWELLGERGLDKLTLNGVARQADCARSSVYRYFDSKEQLLGEVLQERVYFLRQQISDEIQRYSEPAEQVVQGLYLTVVAVKHGPSLELFRSFAAGQGGEIADVLIGMVPEMASELLSDPVFSNARRAGRVRDELSDQDILQWLITIAISLVEQPSFGEHPEQELPYLRKMLVPSIFN